MSPTEVDGVKKELLHISAATLLLFVDVQLAKHDDSQWNTCRGHVHLHSRSKKKNIINYEVIDVNIASVKSHHVLFYLVERSIDHIPMNQHLPIDHPHLKCPFNGGRSVIQKIVLSTPETDVIKLGNRVGKLSIDVVSGEIQLSITDRDKKNIFFLLKKIDRIVVDQFNRFSDIRKVILFESALKGSVSVALSDRDTFQNATANTVSAEDSFANLHPIVRV
jgi:hypothetical protein